jgi:hypothetical protein
MMSLALEITCGALFGIEVDDDVDEITSATLTALHGVVARARNPISLPLIIPTPANLKMKRAIKRLDKAVAAILTSRELNQLPEQNRFMKGIFAWVGFRTSILEFDTNVRFSGKSHFSGWRNETPWRSFSDQRD